MAFSTMEAAENFMKDHHGKEILTFDRMTPELIDSMRVGQRMRKAEWVRLAGRGVGGVVCYKSTKEILRRLPVPHKAVRQDAFVKPECS